MITAVHTLVYADDAEAARRFFADVLGLPFVEAHPGWLIFRTGPSELGVHPTSAHAEPAAESGSADGSTWTTPMSHQLSFLCDDLESTMEQLGAKGAEFVGEPSDQGWGVTIMMKVPGAQDVLLYQPRHSLAHDLPGDGATG